MNKSGFSGFCYGLAVGLIVSIFIVIYIPIRKTPGNIELTSPESNDPRSQLIVKDRGLTKITIGTLENDSVNIVISTSDRSYVTFRKFDRVKIVKY